MGMMQRTLMGAPGLRFVSVHMCARKELGLFDKVSAAFGVNAGA